MTADRGIHCAGHAAEVAEGAAGHGQATGSPLYDVVVVGAGVSGCACAAGLASAGASVLLINSSLDVVGLPGYGPDVRPDSGEWEELVEVFRELPPSLRTAWLNASAIPETGEALLLVDRRAVSIDSKKALEMMPGLEMRQGLVNDLRMGPAGHVEVETVFGEVFTARRVVLAPGLFLGGTVEVGEERLPGGRYGEVPATDLLHVLEELGAELREVRTDVGARYQARDWNSYQGWQRQGRSQSVRLVRTRDLLEADPDAEGDSSTRRDPATEPGSGTGARSGMEPDCGMEPGCSMEPGSGMELGCGIEPGSGPQGSLLEHARARLLTCAVLREGGHGPQAPGPRLDPLVLGATPASGTEVAVRRIHPLGDSWPDEFPPTPYDDAALRCSTAATTWTKEGLAGTADQGLLAGADAQLLPDGVATQEFYVINGPPSPPADSLTPSGASLAGGRGVESRPAHRITGWQVSNLDAHGRLPGWGARLWVIGQAAGARDYLGDLRSGSRAAREIMQGLPKVEVEQGTRA